VAGDQTDVEVFGKEGGRARVEMSVEAVLISRRRIARIYVIPTKNRFSRGQSPDK
jgi:hypothetical protein